jgi:hypothetical protein
MRRTSSLALGSVVVAAFIFACSGSNKKSGFEDPNGTNGVGSSGGNGFGTGGEAGTTGHPCVPNAANYDIPGNGCDDDGDGDVDNPPSCDKGLSAGGSAEDFAKAIGICDSAAEKGYGLVSATFQRGFDTTQSPVADQHGILPKFGDVIKPREGSSLGVLSSGYAKEYDGAPGTPFGGEDIDALKSWGQDWKTKGSLPNGYPKAASGCDQSKDIHDIIDVKLELKAPANVSGIKFDFNFYSGEWPAYICSQFNDGFIAYLSAQGFNNGAPDNVSFDKDNNPVSVNNGFFDRCTPGAPTGCAPGAKAGTSSCPGGTAELGGTGFGVVKDWCAAYSFGGGGGKSTTNGGATGWLTSSAPVKGGETFTLEFMIWDTGDGILDSSVLLDNFTWAEGEVTTNTDRPR